MSSSQDNITEGFLTVSICAMDIIIQSSPLMALMFIKVSESLLAKRGVTVLFPNQHFLTSQ